MDEQILIVKAKDVLHLNRYRRRWIFGWMVATASLLLAGVQTARVYEHDQEVARLVALENRLDEVAHEQQVVNENFVKAWEAQNNTAELLISWGSFVKERTDLASRNSRPSFANYRR